MSVTCSGHETDGGLHVAEERMGDAFGIVGIYTELKAATTGKDSSARAFTIGNFAFNASGLENEGGEIGDFKREQNADRIEHVRSAIERFNAQTNELQERRNDRALQKLIESEVAATDAELTSDGRIEGPKAVTEGHFHHRTAKAILEKDLPTKSELKERKQRIEDELSSELEQVALTEQQRDKLDVGVEHGLVGNLTEKTAFGILKRLDTVFGTFGSMGYKVVKENWGTIDGDIVERAMELREELIDEAVQDVGLGGDSQGVGEGGHV